MTIPETAPRLNPGRCGLTHGGTASGSWPRPRAAFAADGLSVPLDEIARRAGVGPGTLYRHFPAKEALWEAVLHDRLQRLADEAEALNRLPTPAPPSPAKPCWASSTGWSPRPLPSGTWPTPWPARVPT